MPPRYKKSVVILMADDDPDDCMLVQKAFEETRIQGKLYFVKNGEELISCLCHQGKFSSPEEFPTPGLILLDLNMPKKDGRQVIKEVKDDPDLRRIPIVVLTTSKAEKDVEECYDLGANSFIIKPVTFDGLTNILMALAKFWFEVAELPPEKDPVL